MSKYNLTDILGESFDSLAKKLDKQKGIDKEEAGKIAGSIAAKKMAGAGKGPTAKQKARVNEEEVSDTEQVFDIIYAAGGKDVAPDFIDAIGEEFEIPFEFGAGDSQIKETASEIVNEVRVIDNRIDGMVNQKFLEDFITRFEEMHADLVEDEPFNSADIITYLHGKMIDILKEKGTYEDEFNISNMNQFPINEEEEEEEEVVQYAPFVEGETTLIRSEIYEERRDLGYTLENQEEYDYLIKYGPYAFQSEYVNGQVDAFVKDRRYNEREEFSLGNDFNSYNLIPIEEVLGVKSDDGTEDNVDNIDKVSSPSTKGVGYNQVSKSNTDEDDMESKEIANPKPMYEDLKKHFKRFM